jgi:DNA polymerase
MTENTVTPLDASLDESRRRYYLDVMGIQCWELLQSNVDNGRVESTDFDPARAENPGTVLQQLESEVQHCTRCQLHKSRKQALAGRGSSSAELMFVLLSPDRADDEFAQLCSGEANTLFTKMLAAINVSIDDVYISSLLKCTVPAKHTISTTELHYCSEFLKQQLQLIRPRLLVVLGEIASRCMLQRDLALDDIRALVNTASDGNSNQFESVPLFVSYSPQELLQQPENKRKAWLDLQRIQQIIDVK